MVLPGQQAATRRFGSAGDGLGREKGGRGRHRRRGRGQRRRGLRLQERALNGPIHSQALKDAINRLIRMRMHPKLVSTKIEQSRYH